MAYTLFGRSQRLKDIHIYGGFEVDGIKCDQNALQETKRLENIFDDAQRVKTMKKANHWKISYMNICSLNAHLDDLAVDNEVNDSDVIGLGETWMEQNKTIEFQDFEGHFASFGRGKGQAAFSRIPLSSQPEIVASSEFSAIFLSTCHFNMIFLYLSQNYDITYVSNVVGNWIEKDIPTVVMGDINENI